MDEVRDATKSTTELDSLTSNQYQRLEHAPKSSRQRRLTNSIKLCLDMQLGAKKRFFEDYDGALCQIHPRQPDLVQAVLPRSRRARVIRYADYYPLKVTPGKHAFTAEWPESSTGPNKQQKTLTPFANAFHLRTIGCAFPKRRTSSCYTPPMDRLNRWRLTSSGLSRGENVVSCSSLSSWIVSPNSLMPFRFAAVRHMALSSRSMNTGNSSTVPGTRYCQKIAPILSHPSINAFAKSSRR